jgi:peroxiredoxin
MKKYVLYGFLLCLAGAFTFMAWRTARVLHAQTVAERQRARLPDFHFTNLSGAPLRASDLPPARSTLVIHYHPECQYCQYEAEALRRHAGELSATNVLMVGQVSAQEAEMFAQAYALIGWDNVFWALDPDRRFHEWFGTRAFPAIFIYDAQGKLIRHFRGETKIEAILAHLQTADYDRYTQDLE